MNTDTCLANLKDNEYLAVGVPRQHAINFINADISNRKIYCFDKSENICSFSVSIITRRNFELLSQFNANIMRLVEAGLITKWANDNQKIVFHKGGGIYAAPLTIEHIFPGIFLTCASYFCVLHIFFLEKIIKKQVQTGGRSRKLWILADKLIDGDRHYLIFRKDKKTNDEQ